ncbi:MAG: ADOP family duplicated permease [Terriglobales bacterium]
MLRSLRRQPGFVLVAVLSLTLGIGANVAIFSVIDVALLRSLPVSHPDQLYALNRVNERDYSFAGYQALRNGLHGNSEIFAQAHPDPVYMRVADLPPQAITAQLISSNFFEALGVGPWRGRFFGPSDHQASAPGRVAIISYAFWQREYHGAAAVLGRTLVLNRQSLEIVGIAPAGFIGLDRFHPVDAWVPLQLQRLLGYNYQASFDEDMGSADPSQPWATQPGINWLQLYARVQPPQSPAAVAGVASAIALAPFQTRYAGASASARNALKEDTQTQLVPLAQASGDLAGRLFSAPLLILSAAVEAVLLIACLNLVLLVLARDAARRQEDAVRLAFGAGRARLFRLRFVEILLLAMIGAALALVLARWMVSALPDTLSAGTLPASVGLDWRIVGFAVAVALLCALVLAIVPRLGRRPDDLLATLRSRFPGGGDSHSLIFGRGGRWFITGQMALAFVLMISAGLLTQSFRRLLAEPTGFDRRDVLTAHIDPGAGGYAPAQFPALYRRLLSGVEGLPGVRSAALAVCGWYCQDTGGYSIRAAGTFSNPDAKGRIDIVSRDFFATAGMHILRGRGLTLADTAKSPAVAVVNQTFLRTYFPHHDPFASQLMFDNARVVGVVADARIGGLLNRVAPMGYLDLDQNPMTVRALEVHTAGDPAAMIPTLRRALAGIAPAMPVAGLETVEAHLEMSLANQYLIARLCSLFALLALALACLGLYGVQAWRLNRRRRELGIRLALGADPTALFRLVIFEALGVTAAGVIGGLVAAVFAVRLLRAELFGLSPVAPGVFALGALAVLVTSLAASLLPALRAARTDAAIALRCD